MTTLAQLPPVPPATLPIAVALAPGGALYALAQQGGKRFLVYQLRAKSGQPGKFDKVPVWPVKWGNDAELLTADEALAEAHRRGAGHGVGIVLVPSEAGGFVCVDLDNCLDAAGSLSEFAKLILSLFPGAAVERSSSGRGLHVWIWSRKVDHRERPAPGLEIYGFRSRHFIALTGDMLGTGNPFQDFTEALTGLAAEYFPPRASTATAAPAVWKDAARPDWSGPDDDDELLARAMHSTPHQTPDEAFGGEAPKASFAQLWNCDEEALAAAWPSSGSEGDGIDHSSADMALASRLAFWTGCNPVRMERLMRHEDCQLRRAKWDRGDYLHRTIEKAITGCTSVYSQKAAESSASGGQPRALLPDEEATPGAAYPIDALPQVMRDAAQAIAEHVQAPLALAAQCVIGAAAHLAQTRANAPHIHKPDGMPCSLFMLTLADSGDRKSECRRLAFHVIDEAEREARKAHREACATIEAEASQHKGKKRDEYLEAHPMPADPRTQYSDSTFEPIVGDFIRGAAAASWDTDEGGQMLGGASLKADTRTATIGGLCKAFDAGTFERTRSRANLEGSGFAYNRRLSVHLLAQSVAVADALHDPLLRGQGFLPRFLFAAPASLAGTRFLDAGRMGRKSWSDPRLQAFWARCRAIQASPDHVDKATGEVRPPVLALEAEGESEWLAGYNEVEGEQAPLGQFAGLRPFAGRAGELARRVAAVLAFFEGRSRIDGEAMRNAWAIVRHSLEEWRRYTEGATVDPDRQQAAALLEWLHRKGWREFEARGLQREGPTCVRKSATRRDKLLAILVEHRHLTPCDGKRFQLAAVATTATVATTQ